MTTKPIVSLNITPGRISEAEGTELVMNFKVDGPIPPEGITVKLEGSAPRIMEQFTVAQTRFNANGQPFYRFDTNFAAGTTGKITGGVLDRFSLEDGNPDPNLSNEAAAGTGFLSNFTFTIKEPTASIRFPVKDDIVKEPDQTYTYTLVPGEGYTVNPNANSGTFTVVDGNFPTVGVTATPNKLYENEQTALTLTFTTQGRIPPEGVLVLLEGPPRAIAEFDVNATNPRLPEGQTQVQGVVVNGGRIAGTNETAGGVFFRIFEPTATITVPVFQDDEVEGEETLTFVLRDGELYNVDPAASQFSVTILDERPLPVVSFSVTPEIINEAEGTELVMNFRVDGPIPPEGITVKLEGNAARIMEQFTVAQTRFNADGQPFYRFDTNFAAGTTGKITGGVLDRFSLEDGNPDPNLSNEAAAGTGFLSNFTFTIKEPTASIRFPVKDDIIQEPDQTYTYTLVAGQGYKVNPEARTGTFKVTDGVPGGVGPVVSVRGTPGTLYESEQTALTLTFTTQGTIPPEGVLVLLEGPPRAIAQFDVNATNPRLPESQTQVQGVVVTGGSIAGTNETAGGVFFRIKSPTATITVPVFKDDEVQGPRELTFVLRDGELYEVNPNLNTVKVRIEDTVAPPVVTMTGSPNLLREDQGTVLELNFTTTGEIPPGGTTVVLEITDPLLLGEQIAFPSNAAIRGNRGLTIPTGSRTTVRDENGNFVKLLQRVVITEANAVLRLPVVDDIIQEPDQTYSIKLVDGQGYNIDPAASNTVTFTVSDGVIPEVVPTVGFTATPTTLYESEQTVVTLTFNTQGTIPEGGLVIFVDSGVPGVLGEFAINGNARTGLVEGVTTTGGEIVGTDNDVSGFFFRIKSPTATISVPVFKDDEVEGAETFTFKIIDGEAYNVNPARSSVTLRIEDTVAPPVVTMTGSPNLLREDQGTVLELNFTTTGEIPPGGTTVVLEITDPLLLGEQIAFPSNAAIRGNRGLTIPTGSRTTVRDENGNFVKLLQRVVITEANAVLRLPVVDDIIQEPDQTYSIKLVDGQGYNIDPAASNTATFTVSDGVIPEVVPTVGFTATPTTLYESEQTVVTLTFNTQGTIPEGGLVIFVDSGVPGVLGEFAINGNARTGLVEGVTTTGGEIVGTDNDVSGFFFRIKSPTATISVPVFKDDEVEGAETFTFKIIDGEAYNVNPARSSVTLRIEDTVAPPVVTMTGSPNLLREDQGTVLELNFTTTGEIPPGGTTVVLEITDPLLLGEQIAFPSNAAIRGNRGLTIPTGSRTTVRDENGNFVKLLQRVVITEANAVLRLPVVDDIIQEPDQTYSIKLVDGQGYNIDPAASNTATFTVSDGVIPEVVPTVGFTATPTTLYESEQTVVTLTFNTQGTIPEGGLVIFVDSGVPGVLGEFAINGNARTGLVEGVTTTGGEIVGTDNDVSGFFFRIKSPTATISVPVFKDDEVEGTETFTFKIIDGEAYNVNPAQGSVTLTIEDVKPTVSVTVSPNAISEADGQFATFTFRVDGPIPANGLIIATNDLFDPQFDFNFDFEDPQFLNGIEFFDYIESETGEATVLWKLTKPEAFIKLKAFDDNIAEEDVQSSVILKPREGYKIDPQAGSATVTISDGVPNVGGPVISLRVNKTQLIEGDTLTITLTAVGNVPANGLQVHLDTDVRGFLGEFEIFDANGNFLPQFTGLKERPRANEDASGFSVIMTGNTATITVKVFNDGEVEGTETFALKLLDGETYNVEPTASVVNLSISDPKPAGQVLFGGNANDFLNAGDGDNIIYAGEGNNVVTTGSGNDVIFAGAGNDFINAGGGNNTIYAGEGNNIINTGSGNDVIYAGAGNDLINAGGGNNIIFAGEGNNVINTGSGNDIVYAGAGNDVISTGAGDDIIYAGGGNNTIDAGTGNDTVFAGSGVDIFKLNKGDGFVTIFGYQSIDKFSLGTGLSSSDLTLTQQAGDTIISAGEDKLAVLKFTNVNSISIV